MSADRARLPDWRPRLLAHFAAGRRLDFELGIHDCARFAAGAVLAVTGVDPLAGVVWRTEAGARRALGRLGVADPVDFARREFPEIAVSAARAGDLAAVSVEEGPALAVVYDARLFLPAARGLGHLPLTDATSAFRV
ncbi:hypothetical protein [uncultured Amaricoccus sp.]|uniref:DUF6950 family protein n=1 Tax=uncultured Amaricoccus sp. TaxID=339341 RepID=UPI002638A472|nr:hypothetical protein [uncultured Amaricoccus sp.]